MPKRKYLSKYSRYSPEEIESDILGNIKSGYSIEEIVEMGKYKRGYIYEIRKRMIEEGTWPTKTEIKEYKRQRKQRELRFTEPRLQKREADAMLQQWRRQNDSNNNYGQTPQQRQIINQWIQEVVNPSLQNNSTVIKQNSSMSEQKNNESFEQWVRDVVNPTVEAYERAEERLKENNNNNNKELKMAKREAKEEDGLEAEGEENVPTDGRKRFIDLLVEEYKSGGEIDEESIELAKNSLYMHPELTNKGILKTIIFNAQKKYGPDEAKKTVDELLSYLEYTEYYDYLMAYGPLIKRISKGENLNFDPDYDDEIDIK